MFNFGSNIKCLFSFIKSLQKETVNDLHENWTIKLWLENVLQEIITNG